mgnify:CR=1 FL=1
MDVIDGNDMRLIIYAYNRGALVRYHVAERAIHHRSVGRS